MSFFRAIFGRPKPVIATTTTTTSRSRDEEIQKKIVSLRSQVATLTAQAQAEVAANMKDIAIAMLKRRKLLEREIEALEASSLRLVEQHVGLDTQRMHVDTITVMREANRCAPRLSADEAVAVLDEVEERLQDVEEISDLFRRPLGRDLNVDDELAELECAVTAPEPQPQPLIFPPVPQMRQTVTEQLVALETM